MYLQQDISPSADEAAMASLAYSQWERAQAESMAATVLAETLSQTSVSLERLPQTLLLLRSNKLPLI